MLMRVIESVYEVSLEAAPWLVLGLVVAGLIHAFLPPEKVTKWLGGRGIGSIFKAALLGAPLPLCSCGVLPVAVGLRKAGASRGATGSFMVSTPETGMDSVSITYALMGPVFAVTRPIAAVVSAVVTGLLVEWFAPGPVSRSVEPHAEEVTDASTCCAAEALHEPQARGAIRDSSSDAGCCGSTGDLSAGRDSLWSRLLSGQRYAVTRLIDDLSKWLVIGLVVAGLMNAFIEPEALSRWGSGVLAYAVMLVIGLPLYVCATASTPIAAAMLMAGVSPGPVLVFLMAGPATNIATLGVLKRELGARSIVPYLVGVGGVAAASGLALDALFDERSLRLPDLMDHTHAMLPGWLAVAALVWLGFIALRPLRRLVFGAVGIERTASAVPTAGVAMCCSTESAEAVEAESCCAGSS